MSKSAKRGPKQAISTPRRGRVRGIAEDALREAGLALGRAGFHNPTLVLRWPEIVGEEVARVAEPVRLQEGPEGAVLTLRCQAGAAVLLQHETRRLIERLNAYLGNTRIARLKLVPGTLAPAPEIPDHPARFRSESDPVSDPGTDLASALARLAKRRKG